MYRKSEDGKQEILFFTRLNSVLEPQTKGNDYDPERERERMFYLYTRTHHIETFDQNIEL